MPRGPADRPIRASEEDLALQAARERALERGAAPVAAGGSRVDPPRFGRAVAATAPVRRVEGATRAREARSFILARAKRKERKEPDRVPDPGGRGGKVDLRV